MVLERFPHAPGALGAAKGILLLLVSLATGVANGQVSSSAYRVLGQPDLRQGGSNTVQSASLNTPLGVAVDARSGEQRLYIADTENSRILAWRDIRSYQIGDPPALILGQPGPQYYARLGLGAKGLAAPIGLAVAPSSGDLYVADFENSRVVRFVSPFDNPGAIEPEAVFGQPNFTSRTALAVSASTLNHPRAVAFDFDGNLWVADSGNHRILRFPASSLHDVTPPPADTVIGQKDFRSAAANAGGSISANGLDTPAGLAFDSQNNLYAADFRNARVLKFAAPLPAGQANPAATAVWGQTGLAIRNVQAASASTFAGPVGLAVDGNRNLYVTVTGENRVLVFSIDAPSGTAAKTVIGQPDFTASTPNNGASPLASPNSLSSPGDVKVDAAGNIFIADSSNHRVLGIPAASKSANLVWGQNNFVVNGVNRVKPGSLNLPYEIAVDYSAAPFALYVADTRNNRVLGWRDSAHFRNGDPADLVIGQPDLFTSAANVDSAASQRPTALSLSSPAGIAVDPSDGTLYVADWGNNRVLRYPRPVNQPGRVTPSGVIGQPDFTTSSSAVVSASTLNRPLGVAIAPGGLFVADTGNNRVLQFPTGGSAAIRVFGQPNMNTGQRAAQASAQTLTSPQGLTLDQASNLYVVDGGANRVLVFPSTDTAPPAGSVASFVIGQSSFSATGTTRLRAPTDVATDSNGSIYIADTGNNRVFVFPSLLFLPVSGAIPSSVIGQADAAGVAPNWDSSDSLASGSGLYAPAGIYMDRQDTLYIADAGNNRVLHFLKPAVVVNAATLQQGTPVARGSIATLFGQGLLGDPNARMLSPEWPRAALNRQLDVSDQLSAPLYYLDARQANFQVPSNAPTGSQQIALRVADTGELVAGGTFLVAAAAPGLFTIAQSGAGPAAALNQDLTVNSASNPAPVGSTIVLYGTGQGQVSPPVADGAVASSSSLSNTVAVPTSDGRTCLASQPSMCVAIGNTFGAVKYSGLAPGFVGLWQINVTVPQGVAPGMTPVRIVINGVPSNVVNVAIR